MRLTLRPHRPADGICDLSIKRSGTSVGNRQRINVKDNSTFPKPAAFAQ
jgi:hypothetical protein